MTVKELVNIITESILYERKMGGLNYADNGDEFYTPYENIQQELQNYDLNNDIVYCNCDDPESSNFYKYFKQNFNQLGIKKLYATYNSNKPKLYTYDGQNETISDIKSGRFQDNTGIMRKSTVIVTNPPFSNNATEQLITTARQLGKDVIIVGPLSLPRKNNMFDLVKNNELNYGYTNINKFRQPDNSYKNAPTAWWTTRNVHRKPFNTGKTYDMNNYQHYDNYDAIECNTYKNIPDDYYGKIGVPWRFLSVLDRTQFNIIDKVKPILNGRKLDTRLIIQKKEKS